MLKVIQILNSNHTKINLDNYGFHLKDWERFFSLKQACGVLIEKNTPIIKIWRKKWGHPVFENKMASGKRL